MAEIHTFICKISFHSTLKEIHLTLSSFSLVLYQRHCFRFYKGPGFNNARKASLSEVLAPKFYMIDQVGWEPGSKIACFRVCLLSHRNEKFSFPGERYIRSLLKIMKYDAVIRYGLWHPRRKYRRSHWVSAMGNEQGSLNTGKQLGFRFSLFPSLYYSIHIYRVITWQQKEIGWRRGEVWELAQC